MKLGRYEITVPITIADAMVLLDGLDDCDIAEATIRLNENICTVGRLVEQHPEPQDSEGY